MRNIHGLTLLSTAYFPNIQYVTKLIFHKDVYIDVHESYQKQSYRNRCTLMGSNGKLDLTIPVIKQFGNNTPSKDILIDDSTNWQHVHWRAICSAYGKSPFFEFLEPEFAFLYQKKFKFLVDFNEQAILQLFRSLGIDFNLNTTKTYIVPENCIYDFRNSIHPKLRLQKPDKNFFPTSYYQVFSEKHEFQPNLSFLDLLLNEGPQSLDICKKSFSIKDIG